MDGTDLSIPARCLGTAVACHFASPPCILSIIEPSIASPSAPGHPGLAWPADVDRAKRLRTIEDQVREHAPEGLTWPIDAEVGNPTEAVAWTAMRDGASLIAMALRAHKRWDR